MLLPTTVANLPETVPQNLHAMYIHDRLTTLTNSLLPSIPNTPTHLIVYLLSAMSSLKIASPPITDAALSTLTNQAYLPKCLDQVLLLCTTALRDLRLPHRPLLLMLLETRFERLATSAASTDLVFVLALGHLGAGGLMLHSKVQREQVGQLMQKLVN